MDDLIDELLLIERRCERAATKLETDAIKNTFKRISEAASEVGRAWSRSWIGYQARVYYEGLQPPPVGAIFSIEWGFTQTLVSNPTRGAWREYAYEAVADEILRRAGSPDLEQLEAEGATSTERFYESQEELLASFDAVLAEKEDQRLRALRDEAAKLKPFVAAAELVAAERPKQFISRDSLAMAGGIQTPPHIGLECQAMALASRGFALHALAKTARQARLYLAKRLNIKGKSVARTVGTIFVGHGRSSAWRDLKDLLQDRLGLKPDEFNLEPAAGLTTKERLEEMLDAAVFAFIVMTAEDEYADATKHARENVIHEVGLFQGRLGFRRAIVLLEDGCAEFSNIQGLGQIRFKNGDLKAKSEEIRAVLEREGVLKK